MDRVTFEDELRRACGVPAPVDPTAALTGRRCHTLDSTQLRPGEAIAAALVGRVRRVVVDAAGTVIDLGRKRRLFTGGPARTPRSSKRCCEDRVGWGCLWPGCDGRGGCLQVDHREPAGRDGPTDVANSDAYCGFHNRIKERGFRPVRGPDGTWTIHRPGDEGPITPAV